MATLAEQLVLVQTAITEVLRYGESYNLDTQGKRRAPLEDLLKMEAALKSQINMAGGKLGVQMQLVRPGSAR